MITAWWISANRALTVQLWNSTPWMAPACRLARPWRPLPPLAAVTTPSAACRRATTSSACRRAISSAAAPCATTTPARAAARMNPLPTRIWIRLIPTITARRLVHWASAAATFRAAFLRSARRRKPVMTTRPAPPVSRAWTLAFSKACSPIWA